MVELISFGYDCGEPPVADVTIDVRRLLRDPPAGGLDGRTEQAQRQVLNTAGAEDWLYLLLLFIHSPALGMRSLAIGCADGRYWAPALIEILGTKATRAALTKVAVSHRDAPPTAAV